MSKRDTRRLTIYGVCILLVSFLLFTALHLADATSFDVEIVADPSSGEAPLEVEFSAVVKAGTAKSFQWEFGDGGKCKEQNCTHTFNRGGTYIVKLTVVSDTGVTVTKTMTFEVQRRKGGCPTA